MCSSTWGFWAVAVANLSSNWFIFMNCTSKKFLLGAVVRLLLSPWSRNMSRGPKKAMIFSQLLSAPWTILGSIPAGSEVYNTWLHSLFRFYWIMDNKAQCWFLLFFFQPASITLLHWGMGVTALGITFSLTDVSEILLNSQLRDVFLEQQSCEWD